MANLIAIIDFLSLPDHSYLDETDVCYYAGEYTAGKGHAYSATNQLILNLKKSVDKKNLPEWFYKEQAIKYCADRLCKALNPSTPITFVPVPPSKDKSDPLYDDRMYRICQLMTASTSWDVRELINLKNTIPPSHLSQSRPTPYELMRNYTIDLSLMHPAPQNLIIVDDVITTGSHYKAIKGLLTEQFPDASIIGLFIARRLPKSEDLPP